MAYHHSAAINNYWLSKATAEIRTAAQCATVLLRRAASNETHTHIEATIQQIERETDATIAMIEALQEHNRDDQQKN